MQRPQTAPTGDGLSAEQLRQNVHRHLRQSGALRQIKGQLRATVLSSVATKQSRPVVDADDAAPANTLVARTVDALVESYLRSTDRVYAHNVFCAEAEISEGSPEGDAELRDVLGFQAFQSSQIVNPLHELVADSLCVAQQRKLGTLSAKVDAEVQARPLASGASLEDKLSLVDAAFRDEARDHANLTYSRWEQRIRGFERDAQEQAHTAACQDFERWKEQELAKVRAEEAARYRDLLDKRVQQLTEAEKAMRHQLATEQFKAHQTSREAELRAMSVETEKAEMSRLTHLREHSLQQANEQIASLKRQLEDMQQHAMDTETSAARARSDALRARESQVTTEADLRVARGELERMHLAVSDRTARQELANEATSRQAARGERGSQLAVSEVGALHQQLQLALERVAQLELTQSTGAISALTASQVSRSRTTKASMGGSLSAVKRRNSRSASGMPPTSQSGAVTGAPVQSEALDIDSVADTPRQASQPESGRPSAVAPGSEADVAPVPVRVPDDVHTRAGGMNASAQRYASVTSSDEGDAGEHSEDTPAQHDAPSPAAATAKPDVSSTNDASSAALTSEHTSRVTQLTNTSSGNEPGHDDSAAEASAADATADAKRAEEEEARKRAIEEEKSQMLREHDAARQGFWSNVTDVFEAEFESFVTVCKTVLGPEEQERTAALERQQQRVEKEFLERRNRERQEGTVVDAPSTFNLKRDSDDDDVSSVDLNGSTTDSEW